MPMTERIETAVVSALNRSQEAQAPLQLAEALSYATLPGGARIRPTRR